MPVEEIDLVVETPEERVTTVVEGALVLEDGQFLVPEEADIEQVLMEVTPNAYQAEIATTHTCAYCDYASSSIVYFNNHLKSHHKCNECGQMFHGPHGKRDYDRHLPTHLPKTPKPEKTKPPSQPRMKNAEQSHACSTCDKVFPFMSYLERHMEKKHDSKSKRKIDFQIENELSSNSTNEIPSVSQEVPNKRRRKQQFVERNEI